MDELARVRVLEGQLSGVKMESVSCRAAIQAIAQDWHPQALRRSGMNPQLVSPSGDGSEFYPSLGLTVGQNLKVSLTGLTPLINPLIRAIARIRPEWQINQASLPPFYGNRTRQNSLIHLLNLTLPKL